MRKIKYWAAGLAAAISILATACGQATASNAQETAKITTEAVTETAKTAADAATEIASESVTVETAQIPKAAAAQVKSISGSFDLSTIPAYSGQSYVAVNDNVPFFSESDLTDVSFESYGDLDALGRCSVAYASVGTDIMPAEKRGNIGQVKPTGWHTVKYDFVDGKYLYNRCHQIGFALSGLNAEERNLMTGTRYFNVTGMLPFEEEVRDYIKNTNHHVLYEAIPVYKEDELIARGLILQAASIEDETIRFCVYIYNVQPGVTIDYQNGTSRKAKEGEPTYGIKEAKDPFDYRNKSSNKSKKYVINIKNKKYHDPNCSSVSKMSEQNKEVVTSTSKKLQQQGYTPCGICQK